MFVNTDKNPPKVTTADKPAFLPAFRGQIKGQFTTPILGLNTNPTTIKAKWLALALKENGTQM